VTGDVFPVPRSDGHDSEILLTNDDGIDAVGIRALADALSRDDDDGGRASEQPVRRRRRARGGTRRWSTPRPTPATRSRGLQPTALPSRMWRSGSTPTWSSPAVTTDRTSVRTFSAVRHGRRRDGGVVPRNTGDRGVAVRSRQPSRSADPRQRRLRGRRRGRRRPARSRRDRGEGPSPSRSVPTC